MRRGTRERSQFSPVALGAASETAPEAVGGEGGAGADMEVDADNWGADAQDILALDALHIRERAEERVVDSSARKRERADPSEGEGASTRGDVGDGGRGDLGPPLAAGAGGDLGPRLASGPAGATLLTGAAVPGGSFAGDRSSVLGGSESSAATEPSVVCLEISHSRLGSDLQGSLSELDPDAVPVDGPDPDGAARDGQLSLSSSIRRILREARDRSGGGAEDTSRPATPQDAVWTAAASGDASAPERAAALAQTQPPAEARASSQPPAERTVAPAHAKVQPPVVEASRSSASSTFPPRPSPTVPRPTTSPHAPSARAAWGFGMRLASTRRPPPELAPDLQRGSGREEGASADDPRSPAEGQPRREVVRYEFREEDEDDYDEEEEEEEKAEE